MQPLLPVGPEASSYVNVVVPEQAFLPPSWEARLSALSQRCGQDAFHTPAESASGT
ncbi:hypothetical protein ACIF80_22605 [Streptomyces sp. NPDC085927]|uniref:hypothetical protein n=1 Tax=Streptomyces sp. NPDC085927 TaxID=3365738 RepID=UPI0037D74374